MLQTLLLLMLITQAPAIAGLPSADEVVVKMMQRDTERRSQLEGYTSVRRYALENVQHYKRAEMLVRMICHVRMEGFPAKNPSFWVKSVQFTHNYEKHGPFWLDGSDTSLTDVRIFGTTELRIDYFDYVVNGGPTVEARLP